MKEFIGNGIYSISEAAFLLKVKPRQVARALRGYRTTSDRNERFHDPLINADYGEFEGHFYLSFHDLIEIRFLLAFRKYGISWQKIRKAAIKASDIANSSHPFCTKEFFTDGSTILTQYARDEGESELLDLLSDQFEADKIFEPYLHHEFEYSEDNLVNKWHPKAGDGAVVLNPKIQFGQPIIEASGLPTRPLFDLFKAENSYKRVAYLFECSVDDVKGAVKFEQSFAA